MGAFIHEPLADAATTGSNTHTGVHSSPDADRSAVEFVVEAAGSTPTVTYKAQGSFDDDTVDDTDAHWFDLMLLPSDSETAAKTFTVTAVGGYVGYLADGQTRFVRRIRIVSSSNTNVTYHATLRQHIAD